MLICWFSPWRCALQPVISTLVSSIWYFSVYSKIFAGVFPLWHSVYTHFRTANSLNIFLYTRCSHLVMINHWISNTYPLNLCRSGKGIPLFTWLHAHIYLEPATGTSRLHLSAYRYLLFKLCGNETESLNMMELVTQLLSELAKRKLYTLLVKAPAFLWYNSDPQH